MGTIDGCQGTAERCSRTEPGRYCPPQSSVLPRSAGSFPCSRTERLCDRQHTRHMSPCRLPCFGSGRCRECRKEKKTRTPKKTPAGRRRNRLTGRSPAAARKPGACRDRRFNGCLPRTCRTWFNRLPRHGTLQWLLPRMHRKNVPLWLSENAFRKEQGKGLSFSTYRTLFYREIFLSGKPSEDGMFTNMSNNFVYPFLKNKKIRSKRKNPC